MNKKVEIKIEKGRYSPSHKNGVEYTSVGFQAQNYGSGSPCDNEEEIKRAIEHCRKWILKEGDRPFVVDLRKEEKMEQMTLIQMKGGTD